MNAKYVLTVFINNTMSSKESQIHNLFGAQRNNVDDYRKYNVKPMLDIDEEITMQTIHEWNMSIWLFDWTEMTRNVSIKTILKYKQLPWMTQMVFERCGVTFLFSAKPTESAQFQQNLNADLVNYIMHKGTYHTNIHRILNFDVFKIMCKIANITMDDVFATYSLCQQSGYYSCNPNLKIADIMKYRGIVNWKWNEVSRNSGIKMNDIFNTIKTIPWSFQNVLHNPNLSLRMFLYVNPKHMDFNHKPLIFELIREYYENKRNFDDMTPVDWVLCNEYVMCVIGRY